LALVMQPTHSVIAAMAMQSFHNEFNRRRTEDTRPHLTEMPSFAYSALRKDVRS